MTHEQFRYMKKLYGLLIDAELTNQVCVKLRCPNVSSCLNEAIGWMQKNLGIEIDSHRDE